MLETTSPHQGTTVPRPDHRGLWYVAADQGGYFTADQAQSCGISRRMLTHHARTGRYERVRHGLYRLRDFPPSAHEEVLAGWLGVGADRGVVSHESALSLYDLTDVIPDAVHVTVSRAQRWLSPREGVVLHTLTHSLAAEDVVTQDGIRLTAPERTLFDVAESGTAPEQVVRGVRTALARGLVVGDQLLRRAARARSSPGVRLIARALDDGASTDGGTVGQRPA